jgi:DnaJ like chaperone protein
VGPETILPCPLCHERPVEEALELFRPQEEGRAPSWTVSPGCLPCLRREGLRSALRLFARVRWLAAATHAIRALALRSISPTVWLTDVLEFLGMTPDEFAARQGGMLTVQQAGDAAEREACMQAVVLVLRALAQGDGETAAEEWQAVRRALFLLHQQDEASWQALDPGRVPLPPPTGEKLAAALAILRTHLRRSDGPLLFSLCAQVAWASDGLGEAERRLAHEIAASLGYAAQDLEPWFGARPEEQSPYAVLGVAEGAAWPVIRKAYLKLALEHHPDRVACLGPAMAEAAHERMSAINRAYQALRARRSR